MTESRSKYHMFGIMWFKRDVFRGKTYALVFFWVNIGLNSVIIYFVLPNGKQNRLKSPPESNDNACRWTCRCMVILLINSDLVLTPDESRWCSMWLVCCHIVVGGGWGRGGWSAYLLMQSTSSVILKANAYNPVNNQFPGHKKRACPVCALTP